MPPHIQHVVIPWGPRHVPGRSSALPRNPDGLKRYAIKIGVPGVALEDIFSRESVNVGRFTRHLEDWCAFISSLGVCGSPDVEEYYSVETLSASYGWITGIARNSEALKLAAERAWNLMKVMNVMEGFSRSDDRPPDRWFEPLDDGKTLRDFYSSQEITREDFEGILRDYYRERGWDPKTAIPSHQTLAKLGLPGPA